MFLDTIEYFREIRDRRGISSVSEFERGSVGSDDVDFLLCESFSDGSRLYIGDADDLVDGSVAGKDFACRIAELDVEGRFLLDSRRSHGNPSSSSGTSAKQRGNKVDKVVEGMLCHQGSSQPGQ